MKEIFTEIYKKNTWLSEESASGLGSELRTTVEMRDRLPKIFAQYGIKSLLDLGCGDFNWMSHVVAGLERYTGIDVVENIIESNHNKYSSNMTDFGMVEFKCQDATTVFEEFHDGHDAVMVRDILVHFSFADIEKLLKRIFLGDIKYFFTTSFLAETNNMDIPTGLWRRLSFLLPPFDFLPPIETIISYSEPYNDMNGGRCFDKTLSMWAIKDLRGRYKDD